MTCWQPATFTFSPLSCLNGDIYNEVILTGHPILLFITFLSVNEQSLSFFFVPPDEVLNTSIVMSLWGRDSSICDPFCCNYTPSTKWDMTWVSIASSSLAVFFFVRVFFFLEPLQCLFCRPSVKPTFVWGTDILNNDRWKTWGRTRCNDKVETLDRNRQVRL